LPRSRDPPTYCSPVVSFIAFHAYDDPPNLHSFPTRRSSDLDPVAPVERAFEHVQEPLRLGDVAVARDRVLHRRAGEFHEEAQLRSEEHTSELQSRENLVCRLLLEKKKRSITVSTTSETSRLS